LIEENWFAQKGVRQHSFCFLKRQAAAAPPAGECFRILKLMISHLCPAQEASQ
jgi:hypothetical protein